MTFPPSVELLIRHAKENGITPIIKRTEELKSPVSECITLVYKSDPHLFSAPPNIHGMREAVAKYNLQHSRKIGLELNEDDLDELKEDGSKTHKKSFIITNERGILRVHRNFDGHVFAVPKQADGKVPQSIIRDLIGARSLEIAREAAQKELLAAFKTQEMTPFLGRLGENHGYYFDEEAVEKNGMVRVFNGVHEGENKSVLLPYGDLYGLIRQMHPQKTFLVELNPRHTLLFHSPPTLKGFKASKEQFEKRNGASLGITLPETLTEVRKHGLRLELGPYVIKNEYGVLYTYERIR